jgi:hypothetical protein
MMGPVFKPAEDAAWVPIQPSLPVPPLPVQNVALLLPQASVTDWPVCRAPGIALKLDTVAAGGALVTVTSTVAGLLVPPAPLQVKMNVSVPTELNGPTEVPELAAGREPVQPSLPVPPLGVHAVAFSVLQESRVDCPASIAEDDAVKERMLG